MDSNYLNYCTARELLREGDVLLFRGRGIIGNIIKRAGEGRYSHVGVASVHPNNGGFIWECIEFREFHGGRIVNLEQYYSKSRKKKCLIDAGED